MILALESGEAELIYETFDTGIGNFRNLFTSVVYSSHNIEYAFNCHGCSDLFGCIGVRSKKYYILNKQYTKESFDELRTQIIEHMNNMPYVDKRGIIYKYGEFFQLNFLLSLTMKQLLRIIFR